MKTLCIQIGNSDNKLTQGEWSDFCLDTHKACLKFGKQVHLVGYSASNSQYQNACVIVDVWPHKKSNLISELIDIKDAYRQDSIAVLSGETEFI